MVPSSGEAFSAAGTPSPCKGPDGAVDDGAMADVAGFFFGSSSGELDVLLHPVAFTRDQTFASWHHFVRAKKSKTKEER